MTSDNDKKITYEQAVELWIKTHMNMTGEAIDPIRLRGTEFGSLLRTVVTLINLNNQK